jgi:hypothetical protein
MRPRILLLALSDWFGPTRLPHALQNAGFEVGLLAEPDGLIAQSRFIDYRFALSLSHVRLGVLAPLIRVMTEFEPRLVLPCDEAAVNLLQNMATGWAGLRGPLRQLPIALSPALRELLLRSLGDARSFLLRSHRAQARKLVAAMGVPAPPSVAVPYLQVARGFAAEHGYPVVLTRDERTGGVGARLCHDDAELREAYTGFTEQMDAPPGLRQRLRQALWSVRTLYHLPGDLTVLPRAEPDISVEMPVPGQLASHSVVAYDGRALAGLSAVAEKVHPAPLGAGTVVRLVQDAEMTDIGRRLVARSGFTGFAGLDFVRDATTGRLWFLKFTPRPTPLAHLGHLAGGDLCEALLVAVTGGFPVRQRATKETTVALFPQDWMRDPDAVDRGAEHLDVPEDDPRLLSALMALLPHVPVAI